MAQGNDDLGRFIVPVAGILWGNPRAGGTKTEVRFGDGRTVNPQKGTWFVHGEQTGGGVLALIERETGSKGRDAIEWLRKNGFDVEDRQPQAQAGSNRNARPAGQKKDETPIDGAKRTR